MSAPATHEVTSLLTQWAKGNRQALDDLTPLVYKELRQLAASNLRKERQGHTLQPTALVHEAYVRLVGHSPDQRWDHRGHFFAAAAEAMRHILVDNARRKRRDKHGGGRRRVELNDEIPAPPASDDDLLALDEALDKLSALDAEAASVVKLRYFAGLSVEEAAETLGMSRASAYRHWTFARAWLLQELSGDEPADSPPQSLF